MANHPRTVHTVATLKVRAVILLGTGYLADWLIRAVKWRTVAVRNLMTTFPLVLCAGCLVGVTQSTSKEAVIGLLSVGVGSTGMLAAGAGLAPIDLFPDKVGALFGVFNMLINTPGFITPRVTGTILDNANCPSAGTNSTNGTQPPWHPMTPECKTGWETVFLSASAILVGTAAIQFVTFGADKRYKDLG
jgi:hypothetical protein